MIIRPFIPPIVPPIASAFGSSLPWDSEAGGGLLFLPSGASVGDWRMDFGVTVVGGKVSVVADASGNGRDASQGTDASRPAYTAASANVNGKAVAVYTGTEFLRTAAFAVSQPFVVIQIAYNTAVDTRVSFDSAATNVSGGYYSTTYRGNAGTDRDTGVGGNTLKAIRIRFENTASGSVDANGSWSTPDVTGALGAGTLNGVTIGANRDALGNGFVGEIARTIVTTSTALEPFLSHINSRAYGVTVT
jgi:hypothetical protein